MAQTETKYFKKIGVVTAELRLSNGKPIEWVPAGWNVGVLETTDELTISELIKFAEEQKGGVTVIDKATHDDLKKNSVSKSPNSPWMSAASLGVQELRGQPSPKVESEKPSKSAAAGKSKPAQERTEKPATATGVFPPDAP